MKKAGFIIGLFLFFFHLTLTVKAEGLNQYELEVIEEAKKFFEVDGVTYQVKESYIQELTSYLSTEIDLTKEQKDKVLHTMHSNVETGIKDGYLKVVEIEKENPVEEDTDSKVNSNSQVDSNSQDEKETPPLIEDAIDPNSQLDNKGEHKDIKSEDTRKNSEAKMEKKDSIAAVKDIEDDTALTWNTVIKNTGFSLENTFLTLSLIGILFIIAFIVTYQCRLFAHNNE